MPLHLRSQDSLFSPPRCRGEQGDVCLPSHSLITHRSRSGLQMGRNQFSSQEVWGKVAGGQEPSPVPHGTGAPWELPDQLPRLHPQLPGAGVLPGLQSFWRAVAEGGGGAVLLRESGAQGCPPHTAPTHLGLGSEQGSRSKVGCSHLLPFWLYSNGESLQAGIIYGHPALSAPIKTTKTLLLISGAVSWRGLQSLSISGPFPFHLPCSCACCYDHPLLPCVHPTGIPTTTHRWLSRLGRSPHPLFEQPPARMDKRS